MSKHLFDEFFKKWNGFDNETVSKDNLEEFNKDVAYLVETVPTEEFITYDFEASAIRLREEIKNESTN